MFRKHVSSDFRAIALTIFAASCSSSVVYAANAGDFDVAYGFSAGSTARTVAPTPSSLAGIGSFGVFVTPRFLVAGSTQTFTSAAITGSARTWGYGVSKLEFNGDATISAAKSIDLQGDYTIVLPTDGSGSPGTERYGHQFLAMLDYQYSPQNYFEVDAGDFMGGRPAAPGYKNTALLSLISQHNVNRSGTSPTNLDFELDASPSSEGAPASAVLTVGAGHKFKSHFVVTALAGVGLTANDPAISGSIVLKFLGSLAGKSREEAHDAMNFSKIQRLERFGRIGRF